MDTTLLSALSAFTRTLGQAPHPDEVARALVESLAEPFDVVRVAIMAVRGHRLVILGVHGYAEDELAAMRTLPMDGEYPLTHAIREGEVIIDANREIGDRYSGARREGGSWHSTVARVPDGTTLSVPISCGFRTAGACALITEKPRVWDPLDVAALEMIGHLLGIWLTHPDSGFPVEDGEPPPTLTARQVAILTLVAEDRSNPEIAAMLGYSESTVKQELQRVLRSLGASGRHEAAARASGLGLLDQEPA